MAHGKDPAFPLYARDFLTDARLWSIHPADGFALVRLWSFLWTEGPQSMDAIRSAAPMLRCDPDTAERLALEFTEEDDSGRRFSRRLEAEREEREQIRERRRDAGRRGAEKRWGKPSDGKASGKATGKSSGRAMAKPLANDCPSSSTSTATSNLSGVSRIPDSQAQQPSPSARADPITVDGTLRPSEGAAGAAGRTDSSQKASDSPVTAPGGRKVSTHRQARENAAQGRTGAFNAKPSTRRGTHSVSSVVGGIMRHLEGGAA